jgi:hypothetical protein
MGYNRVMLFEFFGWWYGQGWIESWKRAQHWVDLVRLQFSIPVLLRTLFSPWRQIVSLPGRSLEERFRSALDNLVSRFIGFLVRLLVLFTALLLMVVVGLIGLVIAIIWPLIPLAFAYGVFRSITG